MTFLSRMSCRICNRPLASSGHGRPRVYCDDVCKYRGRMLARIERVAARLESEGDLVEAKARRVHAADALAYWRAIS